MNANVNVHDNTHFVRALYMNREMYANLYLHQISLLCEEKP